MNSKLIIGIIIVIVVIGIIAYSLSENIDEEIDDVSNQDDSSTGRIVMRSVNENVGLSGGP
jgi:hypothetical protein